MEPYKVNGQNIKLRWKMYEEVKLANKALHIEFLKAILENIAFNKEYCILIDGRMFVTIWSRDLFEENNERFIAGGEEVRKLFLRLVDKVPNLNFKSETFKIWKNVAENKEQCLVAQRDKAIQEQDKEDNLNWDLLVCNSQME